MQVEVERAQSLANQMEKRGKNFDKVIAEWKAKVDDMSAELDASQKECRNFSTELFRLKTAYDEGQEHMESVRRENKNLSGKNCMPMTAPSTRVLQPGDNDPLSGS